MRNARLILTLGIVACLAGCASSASHQASGAKSVSLGAGDPLGNQIFNSPSRQIQRQAVSQKRRNELTEASESSLR